MKIDVLNAPLLNNKETREAGEKTRAASAAPETAPKEASGDVVQLSDRSRLIARARELAGNAPEARVDKVNDLKARIDAGAYDVSGRVVAEAMLKKGLTTIV
jgi:negative regulator of flagellin synthesis FlgM